MSRGSASAAEIERIYRTRSRAFLRTTTALVRDGDAALDIVHEGFAHALAQRRSFRGDGSLEGWIWRIVLNIARDQLRARSRTLDDVPLPREPSDDGPDLQARLLALPERQRLAVFLRYYADMTYDEIAEALGVTTGTVAASLNAARRSLREALQAEAVG